MNDRCLTRLFALLAMILVNGSNVRGPGVPRARFDRRAHGRLQDMRGGRGSMRSRWLPWFLTAVLAVIGFPARAGNESECAKKAAARPTHECIACEASVSCLERVTSAGGSAEIIPISHGLMVIYNTPVTRRVGEVQNAALERWDIMDRIIAGKGEGFLCASCCAARTLMMRSDRQVYRTSTGVVAMITSEDFVVVRELHKMAPRRRVVPSENP